MTIIASAALANGLRTDFADTYMGIRNRQPDEMIGRVMDLGVGATNRRHTFAYYEAAPHAEHWPRGSAIPTDGHKAISWDGVVYNWGRRVPWHMDDRADDQLGALFDSAKGAGESFALLPERFFFDVITGTAGTLPAVPLAADGAALYAANRFGLAGGNIYAGTGVATLSAIVTDYYTAMARFRQFQDGKGQPLFSDSVLRQGVTVVFGSHLEQIMEMAFRQLLQGVLGPDNTTDAVTSVQQSNVIKDANRQVTLWPTSRIGTSDDGVRIFLNGAPKKSISLMDREGVVEQQSLVGSDAGDLTKNTGEEFIQWHSRQGITIGNPYDTIEITN